MTPEVWCWVWKIAYHSLNSFLVGSGLAFWVCMGLRWHVLRQANARRGRK